MSIKPANLETRVISTEIRKDESSNRIVGYASVFNSDSEDLGGFTEQIAPGAFDRTIKQAAANKRKILALINHDEALILGHTENQRLKLTVDDNGLGVDINPSDTSYARDLIVNLADENADKMSFAFVAVKENWIETEGKTIRVIEDLELYEVSALQGYAPAYPSTTVALRMYQEYRAATEVVEPEPAAEVVEEIKEQPKGFDSFDLLQKQMELELL